MRISFVGNTTRYLLAGFLIAFSAMLIADDDIQTEQVVFESGKDSTIIEASISGYAIRDYALDVETGQHMDIRLKTTNTAAYFNVLAPGEKDVAMFIGSIAGDHFTQSAEQSGVYTLRVYMMRSAARRNEIADYTLSIALNSSDGEAAS